MPTRKHRTGCLDGCEMVGAIRRLALDLDADGNGLALFELALGPDRGRASHRALAALVMTLCCHGRRPFVVGHPRSPMPSVAERHVLALLAAAQRHADHEVEVRLATLLPPPWQAAARAHLQAVAQTLARTAPPCRAGQMLSDSRAIP